MPFGTEKAALIGGGVESFVEATGGASTADHTIDGKNYRIHKFTSSDDFVVSAVGSNDTVDIMIIGGGGAGGSRFNAGGGGAGGMVYQTGRVVTATTYGIVNGSGGAVTTG